MIDDDSPEPTAAPGSVPTPEGNAFDAAPDIIANSPAVKKPRRLAPIVSSIVAVLVLIAGGTAFAAYHFLHSSGSQPEAWAPAGSVAFIKLDLDPPAGEKIAAYRFTQKFPSVPRAADADDLENKLFQIAFGDDDSIDYATDIKPWLGKRVGVAVYPGSNGKASYALIVQVKDADKAKVGLDKLAATDPENSAYTIDDDYAIIGETRADVDAAVSAAKEHSLADDATYASDVAKLHTDRLVTGWVDLGRAIKLAPDLGDNPQESLLTASAKGRLVMGVRLQPDFAELEVMGIDLPKPATAVTSGDAAQLLGALPSTTAAAVAISHPDQILKSIFTDPAVTSGGLSGMLGLDNDSLSAVLDDIYAVIGDDLAVSLDDAASVTSNVPSFSVRSHPKDLQAARALVNTFLLDVPDLGGLRLQTYADGDQLVISDHAQAASDERLGATPAYRKAMGDMPSSAYFAAYADLHAVLAQQSDLPADAAVLQGMGMVVGSDDGTPIFRMRITVK